jgi:hypothetical protein
VIDERVGTLFAAPRARHRALPRALLQRRLRRFAQRAPACFRATEYRLWRLCSSPQSMTPQASRDAGRRVICTR